MGSGERALIDAPDARKVVRPAPRPGRLC